jgi:hypothetical protein
LSAEDTWETYARTFVGWLRYVGLTQPKAITADGRAVGVTRRGRKSEYFLPSSYVTQIITLMEKFDDSEEIPISGLEDIRWAKWDCIQLGLIEEDEDKIRLTLTGNEFILNQMSRPRVFKDCLLGLEYIEQYLHQIEDKGKTHLEVLKTTLGETAFTEETWMWRSKILANWLEFAGIIQRKAGIISISKQRGLFEP